MSITVGLPPSIIGWLKGPVVPIVDQNGLPVDGVAYAFGFAINDKGYIGGGLANPQHTHTTWQYDPATHSWSQVANFPGTNDMIAPTFAIGNSAYVCTGGGNGSKENWQYDQLTNTWSRKTDFPGASRFGAVATAINGKGYVGLGLNTQAFQFHDTRDWWEYDPVTDSWAQKAQFPGTRREYAVAFTIKNKGYVACGSHNNSNMNDHFNDLWQYNPSTDTWTQKADLPAPGRSNAIGVGAFSNKGVVATGTTQNSLLNDCWEYSPSSNSWAQLPNVGGGLRENAAAFAIGNTLYIGTGGDVLSGLASIDFWGLTINP